MADAPQGAAAPEQSQGGGIAEAIQAVDQMANKIAQAVAQNDKIPDEVKADWQAAVAALRKAEESLVAAAGGEAPQGEPDADEAGGAASMEQGGGNAVPMTHQNMRG